MHDFALEELEFGAIRQRLAGAAATEHGEALALGLRPTADADEVARRQALTAEAIALLEESVEPPLERIGDVREQVGHAALGGALSPQALRRIADTVSGALRARSALDAQEAPLLRELAGAIDPALAPLAGSIDRAVAEAPQAARRAAHREAARARAAGAAGPLGRPS